MLSQESVRPVPVPSASLEAMFQVVGAYAREIQNHAQVVKRAYANAGGAADAADRELVAGLEEIREAANTIELVALWFGPTQK